ncbi:MAG: hypothetical protein IJF52_01235 [Clostridia bacterium]|nr:hypothetical protein [Clostridia bacterium]
MKNILIVLILSAVLILSSCTTTDSEKILKTSAKDYIADYIRITEPNLLVGDPEIIIEEITETENGQYIILSSASFMTNENSSVTSVSIVLTATELSAQLYEFSDLQLYPVN